MHTISINKSVMFLQNNNSTIHQEFIEKLRFNMQSARRLFVDTDIMSFQGGPRRATEDHRVVTWIDVTFRRLASVHALPLSPGFFPVKQRNMA